MQPPLPTARRGERPRTGVLASPLVEILLVEDSPDDADLMVEALGECGLPNRVTLVEDGEKAIAYLRRQGPHAGAARPDLVLLDLFLPRKSGHEVLAEIKADGGLRLIPVIVLTSTDHEPAFRAAYDLHANCCVRKPLDLDQFALTVQKIERFWLQVASRPRGHGTFPPNHAPPEA